MMKKVIGSRVDLQNYSNLEIAEFRSYVDDILTEDKVKKLEGFEQHFRTSRLQHSINVAYYSFKIAKKIGADPKASTRAGFLHDLYWYDWHTKKIPQHHALFHPRLAAKNAARVLDDLSIVEEDAIIKHMWPLSLGFPKYKESYVVTLADKYAAALEITSQWGKHFGEMSLRWAKR